MYKPITIIALCAFTCVAKAQSPDSTAPLTQDFGKVSQADLEMKSCDFEKDANAMVLFDVADAYYTEKGAVVDYHKRIKIFNEKGNGAADVRLEYISIYNYEYITGLEAETINLVNGKTEITKVDKKQIFTQRVNATRNSVSFAFPNVKPGSVLEFKYRLNTILLNIPRWLFQSYIPERYNQITTSIPNQVYYKVQIHNTQPFEKDLASEAAGNVNKHVYAMANVLSFDEEPFMSSWADNVQSARFQITGVYGFGDLRFLFDSWDKVGKYLVEDKYFGYEMNTSLSGQRDILKNVKLLTNDEQKIAYIFNEVKNDLKWNGIDTWFTEDGVSKAWQSKTGNATEINLVLYNLLVSAGVEAYPLLLSTHNNGKVNPIYPNPDQFNRAAVYAPGKNGNNYILDASNKYNLYNETPDDLLNSFGLIVDNEHKSFKTIFIDNRKPIREVVFVNAEIKPDGSTEGVAQKSSYSYLKNKIVERYKRNGEEKYREYLREDDNNLKILDLKLDNIDVDSLPLKQNINFKINPAEPGNDYIYFKPCIFSDFKHNAFLAEKRLTDIDFGYLKSYSIIGVYKIPAGFKADALPKSVNMVMPDNSISFTRLVSAQDGVLSVRYMIEYQKSMFLKENYLDFREFYRKMYEMLNEQIVLKKI